MLLGEFSRPSFSHSLRVSRHGSKLEKRNTFFKSQNGGGGEPLKSWSSICTAFIILFSQRVDCKFRPRISNMISSEASLTACQERSHCQGYRYLATVHIAVGLFHSSSAKRPFWTFRFKLATKSSPPIYSWKSTRAGYSEISSFMMVLQSRQQQATPRKTGFLRWVKVISCEHQV